MKLIYPPLLKKGDTVGFVSPSAGLAGKYKYRVRRAVGWFNKYGFKVKIGKYFWKTGYIAGEPEERAEDINRMVEDEEVKCIVSSIGGENSVQLLGYLNFKAFRRNPKIFVGFSDITVLHLAFYKKARVVTFYGPMVLTQFGEYPEPFEYTVNYFFKAVMKGEIGRVKEVSYTDQFLDWGRYRNKARDRFKKNKFLWLREGYAKGKLVGGCLPSILRVAGTKYFPSFKKSLIFLETPEGERAGKPYSLEKVNSNLSQLTEMGVFERARGVIFGIPYQYTEGMKKEFFKLVEKRLSEYNFPILANVNFGHTDPIITIPYGSIGEIDSGENSFLIEIKDQK
ncbi:hypothetical protein DRN86_05095 [Candidatus Geothermarchaeota archaeon]|nr:MAG: hypothetical protein DRN86_05095 [Candidatus Geothermarchaeota archaeon]